MVHNLSNGNSLINQYISEIRDVNIQNDRLRFRRNMERLGEIIAYEISKKLEWETQDINTPLGTASCQRLAKQPVLATILRAGLVMHQGLLNYFDNAENAFIAAYRRHKKDGTFDIYMEYVTCPPLSNKTLIISDPMLASGASLVMTIKELMAQGKPKHIHIATAIACSIGIDHVQRNLSNVTIWAGAVDEELTAKAYIVPGLGDAGDLAFGEKVQE